jgi:hypothetical protein
MMGFIPGVAGVVAVAGWPDEAAAAAATAASDCERVASRQRIDVVVPCRPKEPPVLSNFCPNFFLFSLSLGRLLCSSNGVVESLSRAEVAVAGVVPPEDEL